MFGLARLREEARSFGWSPVMRANAVRMARRLAALRFLKCIVIQKVAAKVVETEPRYECRFLSPAELRALAPNGACELDEEFLALAAKNGDECFGILDGATLAAYGWYTHGATEIAPGFWLEFDPRYVYMYKGFTARAYRGQRLHAVGMGRALNEYLARGYEGIVSYVDAENLSSLKSCYRMGYRDFGMVALADWPVGKWARESAGCAQYKFQVKTSLPERAAEVEVREPLPVDRR
jgi:hypothetical protein